MRVSKTSLLDHVKWLRRAAQATNAELVVAGDSLQAFLRRGKEHAVLLPRFLTRSGGAHLMTPELHDESEAFLGWLPYGSRRVPFADDPASFRRKARALGLDAPEILAADAAPGDGVVVVRGTVPQARQVDGPFRSASEGAPDASKGDRIEQFAEGDFLRVWYWSGAPVCAELDVTPFVVADGTSTVRQLIARRVDQGRLLSQRDREVLAARSAVVLRHRGETLETVLPQGTRRRVEVGYGASPPLVAADVQLLDLHAEPAPPWLAAVRDAGARLAAELPEQSRSSILFTLDAVLDDDRRIRPLELNANPVVHPLAYPAMIDALIQTQPHAATRPAGAPESKSERSPT